MRHDRGLACGTKGDLSYSWSVGQMAVRWELERRKKQRQSLGDNNTSDQTFMAISSGAKTKWKGPSPYGRLWTSLGSKELDCPVWRREGDQPNTKSKYSGVLTTNAPCSASHKSRVQVLSHILQNRCPNLIFRSSWQWCKSLPCTLMYLFTWWWLLIFC